MNKILIPAILGATILIAATIAFMPVQKASTATPGPRHDFALLNTSDTDVRCKSSKPMTVYITMENVAVSAGAVRIEFHEPDGDLNDVLTLDIAPDQTISIVQAARNTQVVTGDVADAEIRVSEVSGADLIGWISAATNGDPQYDTNSDTFPDSFCTTT